MSYNKFMESIEKILKNTTEENQDKVNWTKAWSGKYPVLKQYQNEYLVSVYFESKVGLHREESNKLF